MSSFRCLTWSGSTTVILLLTHWKSHWSTDIFHLQRIDESTSPVPIYQFKIIQKWNAIIIHAVEARRDELTPKIGLDERNCELNRKSIIDEAVMSTTRNRPNWNKLFSLGVELVFSFGCASFRWNRDKRRIALHGKCKEFFLFFCSFAHDGSQVRVTREQVKPNRPETDFEWKNVSAMH